MTPRKRAIILALKEAPGTSQQLVERTGLQIRTIRFYIRMLIEVGDIKGVINFRKDGRRPIYSLTERGHDRYKDITNTS